MVRRTRSRIGSQLRQAIQDYGSMYAVARDSGVAQQKIQGFITDGRDIRLSTIEALCDFFGMRLTEATVKSPRK